MTGIDNTINDSKAVIEMLAVMARSKNGKLRPAVNKDLLKKNLELINQAGSASSAEISTPARSVQVEQQSIELSAMIRQLKELSQNASKPPESLPAPAESRTVISTSRQVSVTMEITFNKPGSIPGLVLRNQGTAESDRYHFSFNPNGQEITITDKWSLHSTRVWGDPHVDLDDIEGDRNGEFSDLKASNEQTSFFLQDGTRLTITAADDGLIRKVDIFKGSSHITGTGSGSDQWSEENQLFAPKVLQDGAAASSALPVGDTVYAGGDGSDWFDRAGKLVWGHTGVPAATRPPAASLEIRYTQTETRSLAVSRIETSA